MFGRRIGLAEQIYKIPHFTDDSAMNYRAATHGRRRIK